MLPTAGHASAGMVIGATALGQRHVPRSRPAPAQQSYPQDNVGPRSTALALAIPNWQPTEYCGHGLGSLLDNLPRSIHATGALPRSRKATSLGRPHRGVHAVHRHRTSSQSDRTDRGDRGGSRLAVRAPERRRSRGPGQRHLVRIPHVVHLAHRPRRLVFLLRLRHAGEAGTPRRATSLARAFNLRPFASCETGRCCRTPPTSYAPTAAFPT